MNNVKLSLTGRFNPYPPVPDQRAPAPRLAGPHQRHPGEAAEAGLGAAHHALGRGQLPAAPGTWHWPGLPGGGVLEEGPLAEVGGEAGRGDAAHLGTGVR